MFESIFLLPISINYPMTPGKIWMTFFNEQHLFGT